MFIPIINPEKSKSFYKDILGLKFISEDIFALEFEANGTKLRLTIVQEFSPHSFTVLGWEAGNIISVIKSLKEKGIHCLKYDFLKQDELGIWSAPGGTKVAWFKDPDGNILSVSETV